MRDDRRVDSGKAAPRFDAEAGPSRPVGAEDIDRLYPGRSAIEDRLTILPAGLHHGRQTAPVAAASGQAWWSDRPLTPTPDVAPTTERFVTTENYLLPAGETLHFYSEIELVRPRGWIAITSNEGSPLPTLTTHGRIIVSPGGEEAVATQSGGEASLDITGIVWRNTGQIYSDWVPGNAYNSHARTAYLAANTTVFNDGLIQATASIAAGITGPAFVTLFNGATGVIRAWSDGFGQDSRSLGVVAVRVTNDGLIEASALNGYEARAVTASEVENSGVIRAHAEQSGYAIGIDSAWRIVNSGLIDAAIAIASWDGGTLTNSGQILGQIYDITTVTNTGYIDGDIVFFEGSSWEPRENVYDGRGGKLDGVLDMGAGVNKAWLGDDGGTILVGATGTSTIVGGAGDDFVDSLGATVAFDGGDGVDIFSIASAGRGFTFDLSASNGDLVAVEGVVGSTFADVLRGTSGENYFWGQGGDDQLHGGDGNDLLDGGAGYDTATFSGARSDYRLLVTAEGFLLKGPDGGDRLIDLELLKFSDGEAIDLLRQYGPNGWNSFVGGDPDEFGPQVLIAEAEPKAVPDAVQTLPGTAHDDFMPIAPTPGADVPWSLWEDLRSSRAGAGQTGLFNSPDVSAAPAALLDEQGGCPPLPAGERWMLVLATGGLIDPARYDDWM